LGGWARIRKRRRYHLRITCNPLTGLGSWLEKFGRLLAQKAAFRWQLAVSEKFLGFSDAVLCCEDQPFAGFSQIPIHPLTAVGIGETNMILGSGIALFGSTQIPAKSGLMIDRSALAHLEAVTQVKLGNRIACFRSLEPHEAGGSVTHGLAVLLSPGEFRGDLLLQVGVRFGDPMGHHAGHAKKEWRRQSRHFPDKLEKGLVAHTHQAGWFHG
jgi:hypothetical protein